MGLRFFDVYGFLFFNRPTRDLLFKSAPFSSRDASARAIGTNVGMLQILPSCPACNSLTPPLPVCLSLACAQFAEMTPNTPGTCLSCRTFCDVHADPGCHARAGEKSNHQRNNHCLICLIIPV